MSYLQLVRSCQLFVFSALSQQVLFYFSYIVLRAFEKQTTGLYGFLFFVDTSFICYK